MKIFPQLKKLKMKKESWIFFRLFKSDEAEEKMPEKENIKKVSY